MGLALLAAGSAWGKIKRPFKSMGSCESVTNRCQKEVACVLGQNIEIVDTPGFFDTKYTVDQTLAELTKCIYLISPGPHAILLVIRIGRFTDEVIQGVELMRKIFGKDSSKFMIMVFTGLDSLETDGISIEEYVDTMTGPGRRLLEDCDMRYTA